MAGYVTVHRTDKFTGALAALLHYEIAAERAAGRDEVKGPGTFIPAFLDELYLLGAEAGDGALDVRRAAVESVFV